MPILFLLFILVPLIEIGVFMQVGELAGLWPTLFIVILTAFIGVKLLKQQGLRAWMDIQQSLASGRMPAVEMASAAQLIFAGGLLLTPGFVTDFVGFSLMIPGIRRNLARFLIKRWSGNIVSAKGFGASDSHTKGNQPVYRRHDQDDSVSRGRIVEGEFEEHPDKDK